METGAEALLRFTVKRNIEVDPARGKWGQEEK